MTVLLRLLALIGWRGAVGAAVGAAVAGLPAYQAGKWTEGAATEARIEAALATRDLKRREADDERIDAAIAARLASDRASRPGADGGGVSDDGYKRD